MAEMALTDGELETRNSADEPASLENGQAQVAREHPSDFLAPTLPAGETVTDPNLGTQLGSDSVDTPEPAPLTVPDSNPFILREARKLRLTYVTELGLFVYFAGLALYMARLTFVDL